MSRYIRPQYCIWPHVPSCYDCSLVNYQLDCYNVPIVSHLANDPDDDEIGGKCYIV